MRVFECEAAERCARIRAAVQRHVSSAGPGISRVYLICHWGVVVTLTGNRRVGNLEFRSLEGFLGAGEYSVRVDPSAQSQGFTKGIPGTTVP